MNVVHMYSAHGIGTAQYMPVCMYVYELYVCFMHSICNGVYVRMYNLLCGDEDMYVRTYLCTYVQVCSTYVHTYMLYIQVCSMYIHTCCTCATFPEW